MSGVTKKTNFSTVNPRAVDFVTRFGANWDALMEILGIMRPIRKTPGTKLISYTASMVDSTLQGGTSVGEAETIPFTTFQVVENTYADIEMGKYAKAVSIEAVDKYGAQIAIEKTDDQFLVELQNKVLNDFYTFLHTGELTFVATTWQMALAMAKGHVLDKFAGMDRDVTEVVGFANILDLYNYLGSSSITIQTLFGLQYVKDFLGYSTLFLLPDKYIKKGEVIALPVENIDLYYIDPGDSDYAKLGLEYTVAGETNLIGFHALGNYSNATGESYALMGMKLWAEFIDGIAVATVEASGSIGALTLASAAGTTTGTKLTFTIPSDVPAGYTVWVKSAASPTAATYLEEVDSTWTQVEPNDSGVVDNLTLTGAKVVGAIANGAGQFVYTSSAVTVTNKS